MIDSCTDVHFDNRNIMSVRLRTIVFGDNLTKPAITIASVERFYLHLAVCLQLDLALLFQNSVKV